MAILHVLQTKLALTAICVFVLIAPSVRAEEAAPDAQAITAADVENGIAKVKTDPNLTQERKVRTLRWRSTNDAPKKRIGWFDWIGDLFGFLAETGRVIVWLAIGVAITLLVVAIARMVRDLGPRTRALPFTTPTHVRDLDIRPESLPDDIGAAALALWEQGEHRAALALLYRGLLSRLVHGYAVPIRQSSTEGDCLVLAQERLIGEHGVYVARVIRVWQRAVYGAQLPNTEDVQAICAGFAAALTKPLASPGAP